MSKIQVKVVSKTFANLKIDFLNLERIIIDGFLSYTRNVFENKTFKQ